MYNSIQYFTEKVIPQIEKKREKFMENPAEFGSVVVELKELLNEFGCSILSEMLTDCNTALESSAERRTVWQIKDKGERSLQTTLGMVHFTHTRFTQKETREAAYLLDRAMGLGAHVRLSEDVVETILEKASEESYRKAGKELGEKMQVSAESVMRHVKQVEIPEAETPSKKRKVESLYVEADEDHIALQYKKEKGDIKRYKGHGDNGQIVKLVYVHEGHTEGKRKELKKATYFGGIYEGAKGNEELWGDVKTYIEETYEVEGIKTIYFQSDGGGWMKRGIEELGAEFVLDEFHISEYIKRMVTAVGEETAEQEIREIIKTGKKKELEEWALTKGEKLEEKQANKLKKAMEYLTGNWKAVKRRMEKKDGIIGSSTESHISHMLSARLSSLPMGWSKKGANGIAKLRIYRKNGGKIKDLLKGAHKEEKEKEELRVRDLINWEKRTSKKNGKYVDAIQASVSPSIQERCIQHAFVEKACL